MHLHRSFFNRYKLYIMYAISGVLSTLVNWITYACCTNILSASTSDALIIQSNLIAWAVTLVFSYVFYKNWVFESKTDSIHDLMIEFASFAGARVITGLIEILGVPVLVAFGFNHTIWDIEGFESKIIITLIVTVLNYVFSKSFVFKHS